MQEARYVITRLMNKSKELGWELWDGNEIIEMTSDQIKKALKKNEIIYGLELGENGELTLDSSFFTTNIIEHRHINKFKPMIAYNDKPDTFFIVLGKNDNGKYEMISTRFRRMTFSEGHLKTVYSLGAVSAGMKLVNNEIILPDIKVYKQ